MVSDQRKEQLKKEACVLWIQLMEESQGDAESGPKICSFSEEDIYKGLLQVEATETERNGCVTNEPIEEEGY